MVGFPAFLQAKLYKVIDSPHVIYWSGRKFSSEWSKRDFPNPFTLLMFLFAFLSTIYVPVIHSSEWFTLMFIYTFSIAIDISISIYLYAYRYRNIHAETHSHIQTHTYMCMFVHFFSLIDNFVSGEPICNILHCI